MGFVSDFPKLLKELKTCGFYIAAFLEHQLLQRHRNRHKSK